MKYLLIIHKDPALHPEPGGPGWDDLMAGYYAFGEELKSRGIEFSGNPLSAPSTATTVRVRDGKALVTDGPFAETREWMSGYYLVDCDNLDVALELARKIPTARFGSVEVRPIMQIGACASADAPQKVEAAR